MHARALPVYCMHAYAMNACAKCIYGPVGAHSSSALALAKRLENMFRTLVHTQHTQTHTQLQLPTDARERRFPNQFQAIYTYTFMHIIQSTQTLRSLHTHADATKRPAHAHTHTYTFYCVLARS